VLRLTLPDIEEVVCLGAHCDDIEIGCGGTMLKLLADRPGLRVTWIAFTGEERRSEEARASAEIFLRGARADVRVETFRGRYLPFVGESVKEYFDELGRQVDPDLVFTHYRGDLHQDHRLLAELTYNTFRDHLVLEYEIPKYDGDLGRPNVFVHLTEAQAKAKVDTIVEMFPTQQEKHWFGEETFYAMLRLRGIESKSPSGHAEAFYCAKAVLG
jgi:LmbE family N-acetylglucosaminyl deacetylase